MIKIERGNQKLEVSKATYESIFKRMGFEIVDNVGAKQKAPSKTTITKKVEDEKVDEKVEKKEKKKDISNNTEKKISKDEKNDLDNILDMISDNKK